MGVGTVTRVGNEESPQTYTARLMCTNIESQVGAPFFMCLHRASVTEPNETEPYSSVPLRAEICAPEKEALS